MKRNLPVLLAAFLVAVLQFGAAAQDQTSTGFFYPRSQNVGPYPGFLDSSCGTENKYISGLFHLGKDSWAFQGEPVFAIADGEVVVRSLHGWIYGDLQGNQAGDGITTNVGLLVKHQTSQGFWFEAVYGHILTTLQVGDKVYAGKSIGTVGAYGGQEHVHFGVRIPLTNDASDYPSTHYGLASCSAWPLGSQDRWIDPLQFITTRVPQNYLGNPPAWGGLPPGGSGTPIIAGITPLSTPVPGQQFIAQVQVVAALVPAATSVVVTGPGCPTTTSCLIPSGAIAFIDTNVMNVPLRLSQGSFMLYVQQSGQLSNGWPLSVGASPATGTLNVTFAPNPVYAASDGAWYYAVNVDETSGIAVTLTGMNIGSVDYTSSIANWFGTNVVPAHGRISVNIKTTGSGGSLVWAFSGGSMSWSASVSLN